MSPVRPPIAKAFIPFLPVALALVCIQIDFFSLGLALPVIADDFGVTTTNLQWALSGYMLALGSLMIPASRLADLLGRKRILLIGVATFGVTSLACGLSSTPEMLIGFRVLQGVGGAMILPVAFSLVTNATDADVRPRILGMLLAIAAVGTAIGPILGGGLASTIGWQWVFFVNVPVALIALVWGSISLKESKDSEGHRLRELDWLGAGLVVTAVALISLGIDAISGVGFLVLSTIALLVVGLAALFVFLLHERGVAWPMVGQDLMRRGSFWTLVGAGSFANGCFGLMIIVSVIELQQVQGLSSGQAGLAFITAALATALCGPISGRLAGKVPGGQVMAVCIFIGGIGLIVQAKSALLVVDLTGLAVCGFAFGMGYTFTNVATQSVLPEELSGQASGVSLTLMVTIAGLAVVLGAMALELASGGTDMGAATVTVLLWSGIVAVLVAVGFGWTQRHDRIAKVPVPA
ncbi:MAG: MFS transporter [Actinomycetota bacterium]|nr:MFS transporter [Actinomycetota bacterium]